MQKVKRPGLLALAFSDEWGVSTFDSLDNHHRINLYLHTQSVRIFMGWWILFYNREWYRYPQSFYCFSYRLIR